MNNININININVNINANTNEEAAQLRMLSWMMEERESLQVPTGLGRVKELSEKYRPIRSIVVKEIQNNLKISYNEALEKYIRLMMYIAEDTDTYTYTIDYFEHMLEIMKIFFDVYNKQQ